MSVAQAADSVYALLADGTTIEIRPAVSADRDAVKAMYEAMSPDHTYLRFCNLSRRAAEDEAQRTCRDPGPGHVALLGALPSAGPVPADAQITNRRKYCAGHRNPHRR